jgi:hypothetical protein
MRQAMKSVLAALSIVASVLALCVALYTGMFLAVAFTHFTLAEMDWNRDGRTTLLEMFHGADVGSGNP